MNEQVVIPMNEPIPMTSLATEWNPIAGTTGRYIRFLTYNLFLRPPLIHSKFCDYKDQRLQLFVENVLPQFDIICLQEMFRFGSDRKRTLERAASKLGFCYSGFIPNSWSNLKPIDGGIMILSRYPAIEQDYIIYSQGVHADAWAAKGALSALLQILPGIRLLVVCTHLQAEYPGHNFFHVQASQVLELKAFLIRKHNQYPNVPIILAGDFNIGDPATFINEAKGTSFSYALLRHILSWNTSYQESEQLIRCLSSAQSMSTAPNVSLSTIAVGHNVDYTLQAHDWRDLVLEAYPESFHSKLVTYGGGEIDYIKGLVMPLSAPTWINSVDPKQLKRIDYIFYFNREDLDVATNIGSRIMTDIFDFDAFVQKEKSAVSQSESDQLVPGNKYQIILKPGTTRIEPFHVKGYPFPQLSDHFGIKAIFEIVDLNQYYRYLTFKKLIPTMNGTTEHITVLNTSVIP